jgi:hypothetical protein
VRRTRLLLFASVLALVAAAWVAPARDRVGPASHDEVTAGVWASPAGPAAPDGHVRISDDRASVVLVGEDRAPVTLARLAPHEGDVVHVAPRPGPHDELTVVLLTRREEGIAPRFSLRYVVHGRTGTSRALSFPAFLQVDEATATVFDVPPVPVWAPDGSALAWVDWNHDTTHLRAVGWVDDGVRQHPSLEAVVYRLDDVPPGVQLQAWERGVGATAVLIGWFGEDQWRIVVDTSNGSAAVALGR